mmetsp:Transcript_1509/g.3353  ORF Transcript_1509/g.3353 Transcript_1509/m.3353 type:complete len:299 (-) Transcript_1509:2029-2925(-)
MLRRVFGQAARTALDGVCDLDTRAATGLISRFICSSSSFEVVTLHDLMGRNDQELSSCAYQAHDALCALAEPLCAQQNRPIKQLLDSLVEERGKVPDKDPLLSQLDRAILPLTQLVRKMFSAGPYAAFHASAPAPASPTGLAGPAPTMVGQHLLQDLSHANLMAEVSALLGVQHLSSADSPRVEGPICGFLYGTCHRPLICLPTSVGTRPAKNIIYLVDTGAPVTELSPAAFEALGFTEAIPPAAWVIINGVRQQVQLCEPTGNHPDIPLLGADAMISLGAELRVNYRTKEVALHLQA